MPTLRANTNTGQQSHQRRAAMTATTTGLETQMRLEFRLFYNITTMREARKIAGEEKGA